MALPTIQHRGQVPGAQAAVQEFSSIKERRDGRTKSHNRALVQPCDASREDG